MTYKNIVVVTAFIIMLVGCATAMQTASMVGDVAVVSHDIASAIIKPNPKPDLTIGESLGNYMVADYTVNVFDGRFKKEPLIFFIAYKNGRQAGSIYLEKKNPDDMRMWNDFNQLVNLNDKRMRLKELFMKYCKLDLDPNQTVAKPEQEPEAPKEAVSSPTPDFPMPGFAPTVMPRFTSKSF